MFKMYISCSKLCKSVPLLKLTTASEYILYKYTGTHQGNVGFLRVFVAEKRVLCYAKFLSIFDVELKADSEQPGRISHEDQTSNLGPDLISIILFYISWRQHHISVFSNSGFGIEHEEKRST